ncbi:p-hydroxyphenylacetate 3-hydroxylase reductase component [Zestomonas carbonaria]|uniref:p-hydroxyphenylacetate 3-hydroxylase, reductase component n=1 Tax=Zestomonas carbonaria TaxID=2762745 RepID=A0A7U7ICC8_9GAMM|nr:flavin reductase family protein [Pseudomonas carbonaria]CAD5110307.1 p-hydroxyphenylacetate 3-hydroxylase, reductase component [Pseudomonas carbonaria]
MTISNEASFDSRAFRRALGNFATGVTVMTAAAGGRKAGVTANSFNSVSLEPPLVLWSIDKRSSSYEVFERASHFAVNILSADQIDLSNQFARPMDDKFAGVRCEEGAGGAPLFADCSARFQCESHQRIDGGDHWILIGKVVAFDDLGRAPLLYHQGAYSSVLPHPRLVGKSEGGVRSAFQGRLSHNLYYLMTQAVRSYQADYQPKQLATGLRTSEARMLMVLEKDASLDQAALQQLVAMPVREIEEALMALMRKGMLVEVPGGVGLTPAGIDQAEMLWSIAEEQQEKVFSRFSAQQIETFRQVLKGIAQVC